MYVTDSTTPNYDFESATMVGVTFEMFNGTSIDVVASDTLRLTLMDVVWKVSYTESSRSDTFHRLAGLMHSFRAIELFQ